jgi:hypothetical protein
MRRVFDYRCCSSRNDWPKAFSTALVGANGFEIKALHGCVRGVPESWPILIIVGIIGAIIRPLENGQHRRRSLAAPFVVGLDRPASVRRILISFFCLNPLCLPLRLRPRGSTLIHHRPRPGHRFVSERQRLPTVGQPMPTTTSHPVYLVVPSRPRAAVMIAHVHLRLSSASHAVPRGL